MLGFKIYLAAYSFNPIAEMRYINLWCPIFVTNYQIPPLMSIKQEHIMLEMIVQGICLCNHFFNTVTSHFSYLNCIMSYICFHLLIYIIYISKMLVITMQCICSNQFSKNQVKDMDAYIEPLIAEVLNLWNDITMYDVASPIR